jgi:hypothetical protein
MINKIVDKFLTNKNLKIIFFSVLLLIFFILLIIPILLCTTDLVFKDILAPIIISLSALLASTVAMINLRTGYIKDILKDNRNDISDIRTQSISLRINIRKLKIYKEITMSKRKTNYHLLNDFKKTFIDLENILKDKTLIYQLSVYGKDDPFELLDITEENLSLLLVKLDEILEWKEKLSKNKFEYLPEGTLNTVHIENVQTNCENLYNIILQIDTKIRKSYEKIGKEEKY